MSEAWYGEGLRFRCTRCGACCSGEPGAVWVSDEEIDALATHLGLERWQFEQRYLRTVGGRRSLIERFDGECVFFERARGCTVYAARPIQCRAWPFWQANVETPEDWAEAQRVCPGTADPEGELVPASEIVRRAREREEAKRRA